MSDEKKLRKRFFVDPKVQGALALRVALYWLVCLVTMTLMLLCWRIITGPVRPFYTHLDDLWFFHGPAVVASLLLLPLIVFDIVRLSNRFTGPMLRLRRSMRALVRGEHVEPIEFRGGDFWQEFAGEFNALLKRVQEGHVPPAPEQDEAAERTPEEEPVGAATAD